MNGEVTEGSLSPLGREEAARLLGEAATVAGRAYAPYSRLAVGAAVLSADGRAFAGCNVENASYGLTLCAERAAVARAVSEGARRLRAVAVVRGDGGTVTPCGACCQVLAEFNPRMQVVLYGPGGEPVVSSLDRFFAAPFRPEHLAGRRAAPGLPGARGPAGELPGARPGAGEGEGPA